MKHRNAYRSAQTPSLIEGLINMGVKEFSGVDHNSFRPFANIIETNEAYELELIAPGLAKENFDIDLEMDRMTISYKKEQSENTEAPKYTRREYRLDSFKRSFSLPDTIELDNVNAAYDQGILKLTLPKKEMVINPPKRKVEIA